MDRTVGRSFLTTRRNGERINSAGPMFSHPKAPYVFRGDNRPPSGAPRGPSSFRGQPHFRPRRGRSTGATPPGPTSHGKWRLRGVSGTDPRVWCSLRPTKVRTGLTSGRTLSGEVCGRFLRRPGSLSASRGTLLGRQVQSGSFEKRRRIVRDTQTRSVVRRTSGKCGLSPSFLDLVSVESSREWSPRGRGGGGVGSGDETLQSPETGCHPLLFVGPPRVFSGHHVYLVDYDPRSHPER